MTNPQFVQLIGGVDGNGKPKAIAVTESGELQTSGGSGGGGGDASAANQQTEIARLIEIRDRISPNTAIDTRLVTILQTLADLIQELQQKTEPGDTQAIAGSVGVNNFPATQPVSAVSLPLPTGALSEGVVATGVTGPTGGSGAFKWLSGIWQLISELTQRLPSALVGDRLKVDGSGVTQPISVQELPLPINAPSRSDIQAIEHIAGTLDFLLGLIARPLWVNPTNSNVNCNIANGTLPTVTTVNTVSTVNNINTVSSVSGVSTVTGVTTVSTVDNVTTVTTLNALNSQPIQNTLMYDIGRSSWNSSVRSRIS